jgi:hypothetical protein
LEWGSGRYDSGIEFIGHGPHGLECCPELPPHLFGGSQPLITRNRHGLPYNFGDRPWHLGELTSLASGSGSGLPDSKSIGPAPGHPPEAAR